MKNYTTSDVETVNYGSDGANFQKIDNIEKADLITKELWWQKQNLSFTATGYGKKIPTEYLLKFNNRLLRVYCSIFSNVGTLYIVSKGKDIIVDINF